MKSFFRCFLGPLVCACASILSTGAGDDGPNNEYTKWVWPVATLKDVPPDQLEHLRELKKVLDIKWDVQFQQQNPGCCLWVDVVNWKPNPGRDAYIVLIEEGGGWIRATNREQLELAIKKIETVVVKKASGVYLPVGLFTNYPLVSSERQKLDSSP